MKFKVLAEFELDGVMQTVDSVIEVTEEVAAPFVAEGKLEKVEETAPEAAEEAKQEGESEEGAN